MTIPAAGPITALTWALEIGDAKTLLRVYLLGSPHLRATPVPHIVGIERKAEEIRGYESKLRGSGSNYADDHAICTGCHPPLPEFPSYENGRKDCKNARDVIQMKHDHLWKITESLAPLFVRQGRFFFAAYFQASISGFSQ